jgi:hypothetical protein
MPLLKSVVLIVFLCATLSARAVTPVYVILWFDTEDYLLPASDDSAMRIANLLTARHIRGTFKVVGEKARTLDRRGRTDVIAALKRHDIGYHANFHSVHPTPAEYLASADFLDGIEEFVRREGGGAADVRRIFGLKSLACYGQPGSSWAPQAIAALPLIGVDPHGVGCYVDDGNHVGIGDQPFWYENAIVVYHMGGNVTRVDLHDPAQLEPAKAKVLQIAEDLRSRGGGLISIYYHPCEFVHREFWDGVNFRRGANPPRSQWRPPGQLPLEQTEAAFKQFTSWLDYIRSIPGIGFVSASQLPLLYEDKLRTTGADRETLRALARSVSTSANITFLKMADANFSPADQFELLTRAVASLVLSNTPAYPLRISGLLGPVRPGPARSTLNSVPFSDFSRAILDANNFILSHHRVPSEVFIGADSISPEDFLIGLARTYLLLDDSRALEAKIDIPLSRHARLDSVKYIAQDTPQLFGGWIIHKENFRAPKLLDVARLQTWTLKPAVLSPASLPRKNPAKAGASAVR